MVATSRVGDRSEERIPPAGPWLVPSLAARKVRSAPPARSDELRRDLDARGERLVDGALVGHVEEPRSLLVVELARELDLALHEVGAVDLRVTDGHRDTDERPLLPPGVHLERDRRAAAEGRAEVFLRGRSGVGAARAHGLIAHQVMRTGGDVDAKSVGPRQP